MANRRQRIDVDWEKLKKALHDQGYTNIGKSIIAIGGTERALFRTIDEGGISKNLAFDIWVAYGISPDVYSDYKIEIKNL